MKTDLHGKKRLLLPVRRKLALAALAYLAGIYAAVYAQLSPIWIMMLCAFLLGWAAWRLAQRKSALLCIMGILLLAGNCRAGLELSLRDMPTRPGVQITGRVAAIEKPYRDDSN